jgi:orotidine-5'-phosphate decarboxylase
LPLNQGAFDFQFIESVYDQTRVSNWGTKDNLMFVVGATKAEMLRPIREIVPDHFLLIPGVAQGGSLTDVAKYGLNKQVGLLINSSRSIIYASNDTDFDIKAREEALKLQNEMSAILKHAF